MRASARGVLCTVALAAIAVAAWLPDYDEEIWQDLAELAVADGLHGDLLALAAPTAVPLPPAPALSSTSDTRTSLTTTLTGAVVTSTDVR